MPKAAADFDRTFTALRGMLRSAGKGLIVTSDKSNDFQMADAGRTDRIGRPLFIAAVQIKKTYVSYHLMPVYFSPDLLKSVSPALKKRMQGKACFNFTAITPQHVRELKALTRTGIARFKRVKLPWA
jgi:hypothetical protein